MIRRHLGYPMAGDGRRPTLMGIAEDRSAMVFITIAFVGMAAFLAPMTATRLELRRLSQESAAWPRVRGEVVDTRLVWSSSPRAGQAYWPTIHYRYSVDGTGFSGERVSFRPSYGRAEAADAVSRFPAGSLVSVWYRPGDPRTSVAGTQYLEDRSSDDLLGSEHGRRGRPGARLSGRFAVRLEAQALISWPSLSAATGIVAGSSKFLRQARCARRPNRYIPRRDCRASAEDRPQNAAPSLSCVATPSPGS
jgi:hypothetical protein